MKQDLLNMIEIKCTKEFGRGIYASVYLNPEIVVETSELLVLSSTDSRLINSYTDLQYYTFVYNEAEGKDCLCLGLGEIFNHSDNPNVKYELVDFDGRKVMRFTTLKRIAAGDQLFIDYNADCRVNLNNYNKNLID